MSPVESLILGMAAAVACYLVGVAGRFAQVSGSAGDTPYA